MIDLSRNLKILKVCADPHKSKLIEAGLQGASASEYLLSIVSSKSEKDGLYKFNTEKFDLVIIADDSLDSPAESVVQLWRKQHKHSPEIVPFIFIFTSEKLTPRNIATLTELDGTEVFFMDRPWHALNKKLTASLRCASEANHLTSIKDKYLTKLLKIKNEDSLKQAADKLLSNISKVGDKGKVMLAEILIKIGDHQKAVSILSSVSPSYHPVTTKTLLGKSFLAIGNADAALSAFNSISKDASENIDRAADIVKAHFMKKQPHEAAAEFNKISHLFQNYESDCVEFCLDATNFAEPEDAQEFVAKINTALTIIRGVNNAGAACSIAGEFSSAVTEFEKIKDILPPSEWKAKVSYNHALAIAKNYSSTKSIEQLYVAENLLEQAGKMDPEYAKVHSLITKVRSLINSNKDSDQYVVVI